MFRQIIKQFDNKNKNSIPFGEEDAQKIGCAIGKTNQNMLLVRCIMNKQNKSQENENSKKLYTIGEPCSQCHEINSFCDTHYKSLCCKY